MSTNLRGGLGSVVDEFSANGTHETVVENALSPELQQPAAPRVKRQAKKPIPPTAQIAPQLPAPQASAAVRPESGRSKVAAGLVYIGMLLGMPVTAAAMVVFQNASMVQVATVVVAWALGFVLLGGMIHACLAGLLETIGRIVLQPRRLLQVALLSGSVVALTTAGTPLGLAALTLLTLFLVYVYVRRDPAKDSPAEETPAS